MPVTQSQQGVAIYYLMNHNITKEVFNVTQKGFYAN